MSGRSWITDASASVRDRAVVLLRVVLVSSGCSGGSGDQSARTTKPALSTPASAGGRGDVPDEWTPGRRGHDGSDRDVVARSTVWILVIAAVYGGCALAAWALIARRQPRPPERADESPPLTTQRRP